MGAGVYRPPPFMQQLSNMCLHQIPLWGWEVNQTESPAPREAEPGAQGACMFRGSRLTLKSTVQSASSGQGTLCAFGPCQQAHRQTFPPFPAGETENKLDKLKTEDAKGRSERGYAMGKSEVEQSDGPQEGQARDVGCDLEWASRAWAC